MQRTHHIIELATVLSVSGRFAKWLERIRFHRPQTEIIWHVEAAYYEQYS